MTSCISVVVDGVNVFLKKHIQSQKLLSLYQQRLEKFAAEAEKQGFAPSVDVPYFLCLGLSQDTEKSRRMAVLSTLIFLGCDLLDDFQDGDLHIVPSKSSITEVTLASSILLSALPTLAISEFFGKESLIACQTLAQSLLAMAQGQERDILSRFDSGFSVEEAEAVVMKKSGEEMALFCRLVAQALSQSVEKEKMYAEFGRHFGVAIQIVSDLSDIFEVPLSSDLQQGTLTLPLALHLSKISREERELFDKQWRQSPRDHKARDAVKKALEKSGALADAVHFIQSHCEKAETILKTLGLDRKSQEHLEEIIGKMSGFLQKPSQTQKLRRALAATMGM